MEINNITEFHESDIKKMILSTLLDNINNNDNNIDANESELTRQQYIKYICRNIELLNYDEKMIVIKTLITNGYKKHLKESASGIAINLNLLDFKLLMQIYHIISFKLNND